MNQPERIFKALGDPARIKILRILQRRDTTCCVMEGCVCACDVERILGIAQATVSHHMKHLIDAGLVHAEKRGRWVHYWLDAAAFSQVVEWLAPFANAGEEGVTCGACEVVA